MLTGLLRNAGATLSSSNVVSKRTGPQAQIGQEHDRLAETLPENWSTSATIGGAEDQSPGELVPTATPALSLTQRIAKLTASRQAQDVLPPFPPDRDPLDLTEEEMAGWRAEQISFKGNQRAAPPAQM